MIHLVLHEPEIPNNTGAIGRLCVGLGMTLHLIHPVGFDLGEKAVRRSGLDYWSRLVLAEHADWRGYLAAVRPERVWLLCAHAERAIYDADLRAGDHLVLGKESDGLPDEVLRAFPGGASGVAPGGRITIPMTGRERSLNLATAAAAVASEALRQALARGERAVGPDGRLVERASG